ncbi:hypothetical protein [Alicyclobacillus macrosporangiidus]|uniref:hypothetical protein n=1 Tax=Alicyclobacillus macrosporangiidus TaxID=392015 RepID=UPI00054FF3DE|nr:hypothetical protein [Alicyclobacillus macrosporangiidus]
MQLNTLVKFGSLMFNVAQDEKVKELFTMVHQGAKRRGWIGPAGIPAAGSTQGAKEGQPVKAEPSPHPIPFAPNSAAPKPGTAKSATPVPGAGPLLGAPIPWQTYLNGKNAKKVLTWAGELTQLLIK